MRVGRVFQPITQFSLNANEARLARIVIFSMKIDTRTIRKTTGRIIGRYRISHGFPNTAELSSAVYRKCGVRLDPEGLTDMEVGRRECSLDVVTVLAIFYGTTIDDMVGFTPVMMAAV